MKSSLAVLARNITVAALLVGCNGTGTKSDSTVTTGFSMTGSGQNAIAQTKLEKIFSWMVPSAYALTPPLLVDSTGANITLDEAWIVIKEIEFEVKEFEHINEIDQDFEYEGPFFVDLLSNSPVNFGNVEIPKLGLHRIEMELHKSNTLPAQAPLGLAGKSIYLSGTVNGIAFDFSSDESTDFEISGPNAVMPESTKDMLVAIRIADLVKKIDLSSIVAPTSISTTSRISVANPCPLIEPSATDLYTCFREGLESEADFGKDDGDFELDGRDESIKKQ